ncbi:MAG: type II toxin-antitoxin system HicA family toxin [Streptosporangiaceae bacterium]
MSPKRLPVVSGTRLVRALEKDGFEIVGTRGSHCKLRRGDSTVIVPMHDEIAMGTLASVLRAAGMTAERLRELLLRRSTTFSRSAGHPGAVTAPLTYMDDSAGIVSDDLRTLMVRVRGPGMAGLLSHGGQEFTAGPLAASACLGADPAVLTGPLA